MTHRAFEHRAMELSATATRYCCCAAGLVLMLGVAGGCEQKMADQPRYEHFEASRFYADGKAARLPVGDTVARGSLDRPDAFRSGRNLASGEGTEPGDEPQREAAESVDEHVEQYPLPVTLDLLRRGQQRYAIYCLPCHGVDGRGQGPVVRRGFPAAADFHTPVQREKVPGALVAAIVEGPGAMPSLASAIPPRDRWAIAAYVQALQFSQHAALAELPPHVRRAGGWDEAPDVSETPAD